MGSKNVWPGRPERLTPKWCWHTLQYEQLNMPSLGEASLPTQATGPTRRKTLRGRTEVAGLRLLPKWLNLISRLLRGVVPKLNQEEAVLDRVLLGAGGLIWFAKAALVKEGTRVSADAGDSSAVADNVPIGALATWFRSAYFSRSRVSLRR